MASNPRQCRQTDFFEYFVKVPSCQALQKEHLVGVCPQVIVRSLMVNVVVSLQEQAGRLRGEQTLLWEEVAQAASSRPILWGEKENPQVGVFFKCSACCVVILSELILVVVKSEKNLDCCSSCSASSRGSYRSYSAFCTTCWLLCLFSEFLCMWLGGMDRHLQNCNCWSQIWSSFFLYIPSKELGFSSFWCIGTKYLNCKHCHANACVEKVCTSSSFWSFPFLTATTTTKKSSHISRWQFKFKSCLLCSHGNYYKGICRVHDK